jgi:patatin-like phospholipase/acyl hydrolase
MATKRILAIDGGGIRGLIPALVLVRIEELIRPKRIAEVFDLIAGTSTGGILAAGLCVPADHDPKAPKYAASDLVDLYRQHGKDIFNLNPLRWLVSWLYGPEYSPKNLEIQLKDKLGKAMLKDAVTELLITSYDMKAGQAWFFSRSRAEQQTDHNFPLWEIARATSAAPTFFPPFRFPSAGQATLVDGGVFANNPVVCAWVDAYRGSERAGGAMILSLGTGSVEHPVTYQSSRRWGKLEWARPAISAFLDGQSDTADFQAAKLLGKENYLRLQASLTVDHEKMDNASDANIAALGQAAADLLAERASELDEFCHRLVQ